MMTYPKMMIISILQLCFVTVTHGTVTDFQQKPGKKYTVHVLLLPPHFFKGKALGTRLLPPPIGKVTKILINQFCRHMLKQLWNLARQFQKQPKYIDSSL